MSQTPKHLEFVARYEAIDLYDPDNTEELEALAADAQEAYSGRSKSLLSGFIAASCRFELGDIESGLDFYQRHLAFITKNAANPDCLGVYARFARMLHFNGQHQQASDILDEFSQALAVLDPAEALSAMSIHGEAGRFDRVFAIQTAAETAHPHWQGLMVRPVMLEYYLEKADEPGLVECFNSLASAVGYEPDSDNLDEIFDELEELLKHPRLHPELSEHETEYLARSKEIISRHLAVSE